MEDIKNKIINKLKKLDFEEFRSIVGDINSYDGSLDWLDYQENDEEFFNVYFDNNVNEAVRATQYGDYNYCDDYVIFNAYGNLDTINEWELKELYQSYLEDIAERIIELKDETTFYNDDINEILNIEEA